MPGYPCCCEGITPGADCSVCDGDTPLQYSVTISGMVDDGCGNCASDYNGTFVLTQTGSPCVWQFVFPEELCATSPVIDSVLLQLLPGIRVLVTVGAPAFFGTAFDAVPGGAGPIDCQFSSLALSFFSDDFQGDCYGASATCTVTAI